MSNWRQEILGDFNEPLPSLTLISDPDGLFQDEKLINEFGARKLKIIEYQDSVFFRYLFEKEYRQSLEMRNSFIIIRTTEPSLEIIPFDILKMGRQLHYQIAEFFPKLSAPIIKELDPSDLDTLYSVAGDYHSAPSNAETCDFILRRVYKVAYETIDTKTELFKLLLSKHYQSRVYPESVENYLIEQLTKKKNLCELPVESLVKSASFFYRYIQNQWSHYLEQFKNAILAREVTVPHAFEDPDVRRLIDNLFTEGKLTPIPGYESKIFPEWMHAGLVIDPIGDAKRRLMKMVHVIQERIPNINNHTDWQQIVPLWGNIKEQAVALKDEELTEKVNKIGEVLDRQFADWLLRKFGSLYNLPYFPKPVMVNQISHFIAARHKEKTALLVMDGMSFVQWVQIRDYVQKMIECEIEESTTFAWVPTITAISRQAIFSGELPLFFEDSLDSNQKEENQWKLFWENQGVMRSYTVYQKGLGRGEYPGLDSLLKDNTRVVGLVLDMLDQLGHASLQGEVGLYAEVEIWLKKGFLLKLVKDLLDQGFDIYLSSDHGNKQSCGIGSISQGVLAETRGERVRIYSSRELRDKTSVEYGLIPWPGEGLPGNVFVVLAPENGAFVKKEEVVISHGGISLEEVMVPFVQIKRRS